MRPFITIENNCCYICDVSLNLLKNDECSKCKIEYIKYLNEIGFYSKDCVAISNFIEYATMTQEKFDQIADKINNNSETFIDINDISKLIRNLDDVSSACRYLMNIAIAMRQTLLKKDNNEE